MRYAFIVNPAAGQGANGADLNAAIDELISGNPNRDIRTYQTRGRGDAAVIAGAIAGEAEEDTVIFACGGDGTIHEVAGALCGSEKGILGIVPAGTCNDFIREIARAKDNAGDYLDLPKQFRGMARRVDLIRMAWIAGGREESAFICNGINIGLDADASILSGRLGKLPLVSRQASHLLAGAFSMAALKGQRLRITADGKDFHTGDVLMVTAANGGYCFGGIRSCPEADLSDGLLELMAVREAPRRRLAAAFPKYRSGKVFDIRDSEDMVSYVRARNVIIEPMLGPSMRFTGDGEVFETGALRIDVIPKAIRVLVL